MKNQIKRKSLFVGGVHGIGKSSLCAHCSKELGIGHHVASALIKRFNDLDAGLYKEVRNVDRNQETLISALDELVTDNFYLLDGHLVINSQQTGLTRIPVGTFQTIAPVALVVVIGDAAQAAQRLRTRDGKIVSPDWLGRMQTAELEHGRTVSEQLGVPFQVFDGADAPSFVRLVESLMAKNVN